MYTYYLYGLCAQSDLALPIPETSFAQPDVFIRRCDIDAVVSDVEHDDGRHIRGRVEGVTRFAVLDGSTIWFEPDAGADEDLLCSIVLGIMMATLLRQRGYLVLHASCVSRDDTTIAFVGDSGWGKSTTAAYFCEHGYRLISDDVTAVDLSGDQPVVLPGPPHIRLRPEAGQWLMKTFDQLPLVHPFTDKRIKSVEEGSSLKRALTALYALQPIVKNGTALIPLAGREAIYELIRHTRVTNVLRSPDFMQAHLAQCSRLIAKIPVKRLDRIRRLGELPRIYSLIEGDLMGSSPSSFDRVVSSKAHRITS